MTSPLQSFLSGKSAGIGLQQQQLGLDEARQAAPQNAAIRDANLQRQKQQLQSQQGEQNIKGMQLLGQFSQRAKQLPIEQRQALFQRVRPTLENFGIDLSGVDPQTDFTDAGLMELDTGLGQAQQQITAFQSNLESQAQALVGSKDPDTGQEYTLDTAKQALVRRQSGIDARAGTTTGVERIATTPGLTQDVAASKREIKAEEGRGAGEAQTVTKIIEQSFDKIGGINRNIRNIDRAISAIDRGAGAGKIERLLPSVKAASIELDQIRSELGLDVVGATTFGALSAGELNLALDVALPPLDDPDLRGWLQRKKDAQQKLVGYLDNQIDFMEGGGTVGEWRTLVTDAEAAIKAGADPDQVAQRFQEMARGR